MDAKVQKLSLHSEEYAWIWIYSFKEMPDF